MLVRISAAVFALYLAHGSDNVSRDGARLASEIRTEAPGKAIALCLDNAAACRAIAGHVTGQSPGQVAVQATAKSNGHHKEDVSIPPAPDAAPAPVVSAYPLPPRRPRPAEIARRA